MAPPDQPQKPRPGIKTPAPQPITWAREGRLREKLMSKTAHAVGFSFVERLAQDLRDERLELPAFPEAVLRIQRALQSPDTSTDDVVRILSSEPALAARLLRIANSVEFRRADQDITDLRQAVSRMGFNMVRSVSVAFAMRQLRRKDSYSPAAKAQLEQAWTDSLNVSATCFVIAKRFAKSNPDQALLAGLLHVLGRLYIIMRSKDSPEVSDAEMREVIDGWHAAIGKAILESWGLPETLQDAVAHQDEYETELEGAVCLTDILIAGKLLAKGERNGERFPALRRVGATDRAMEDFAEELRSVKGSLSE
jgi:HD-like signal output (HDOD) protein